MNKVMNQGFSKILIVVIVLAVIAGGVLAWRQLQEPAEKAKQPAEEKEKGLFPCIALDIKLGDCAEEIDDRAAEIIKDYLSNYVQADLSDAETVYCLEDGGDMFEHYWFFKTFYLDHWVGVEAACFTDITEPLPIEEPSMEKEFYRISIIAHRGGERSTKDIGMGVPPTAAIIIREATLTSVKQAQAELGKYWRLDISQYESENFSDEQGIYRYKHLDNLPQIIIRVGRALDVASINYGMIDPYYLQID